MAEDSRKRDLAFSSEYPYKRWFGTEILDHNPKSVRMDFMRSGRAPLLMGHDQRIVLGVIERASIDKDKVGRAIARFGRGADASDALRDVDDAILVNVSAGYRVHELVLEKMSDDDGDTYRVTDWEPLEASLVGIPADPSVGIGRAQPEQLATREQVTSLSTNTAQADQRGVSMSDKDNAAAGTSADSSNGAAATVRVEAGQQQEQPGAVQMERDRRRAIETLCAANKLEDRFKDHWIRSGLSLDKVADDILAILKDRGETNPQPASKLGLSANETKRFSLQRAIIANADNDWSKAGFELECSRAVAAKVNKAPDPKRFFVPFDVLERDSPIQKRDLTTSVPSAAGFLVNTTNQGFIEVLRNRSVAFRMGAMRLSGLQGNVTIPRQSATATAYWLGTEAATITESQQTFIQIAMTPKTVGAYTEVSRNLLMQSSPSAEAIVTDDLARTTATAADLAVIRGSGLAGQPLGIVGTTGIGAVTGTTFTQAAILEFQSDVAAANVEPVRGGYVTTPAVAVLAASRVKFSGSQDEIWTGNVWDGQMGGFPAMSSNQMAAGTCLFGDWNEVVVAEWGVLEVEVNPYANFQAGILGIRCMYSLDVAVRRPFAFSYSSAMT